MLVVVLAAYLVVTVLRLHIYLSCCHRTATDFKYWMIRTLVIARSISCLVESASALEFLEI